MQACDVERSFRKIELTLRYAISAATMGRSNIAALKSDASKKFTHHSFLFSASLSSALDITDLRVILPCRHHKGNTHKNRH